MILNVSIFLGSLFLTLFSVLSAKEQADRLKNGGLGTIASSIVTILITLFQNQSKTNPNLNLIAFSFFGCAFGAFLGWVIIYIIVRKASKNNHLLSIELLYTGLSGVKEVISTESDSKIKIIEALSKWNTDFERTISKDMSLKESNNPSSYCTIYLWIKITCDMYHTILVSMRNESINYEFDKYQLRASLIIFPDVPDKTINGKHYISYVGERDDFRDSSFTANSYAYKVLNQELPSPFLFDPRKSNIGDGDSRIDHKKGSQNSYKSFILFRVNQFSILTIDWSTQINQDEVFVVLKSLFHKSICPSMAVLLNQDKESIFKYINKKEVDQNPANILN